MTPSRAPGAALASQIVAERAAKARARVDDATARAGRPPGAVTIVAVTKGVAPAVVAEAVATFDRIDGVGSVRLAERLASEVRLGAALFGSRPAPPA